MPPSLAAHTSQEFEAELRLLKDRLLAMGGRCERMIALAMQALDERDPELTQQVVLTDRKVNSDELAVDESAMRILALRQPVGRDLRFIITAEKVVTDLERIGDEAVNIAERVREMIERPDLPEPHVELPEMGRIAARMLHGALDSFVEEDAVKALAVLAEDDKADEGYGRILQRCVGYMQDNPERVIGGWRVACCAKYLERIADHATNIAEMVVFMVRGEDVRHEGKRR